MKRSITTKLFLVITSLITLLFISLALVVNFVLPDFYSNSWLNEITTDLEDIVNHQEQFEPLIEDLLTKYGGSYELTTKPSTSVQVGKGQNRNNVQIITSNRAITHTSFTNKYGLIFEVFSVKLSTYWLIYQVPSSNTDIAVAIFTKFLVGLIFVGIIVSLIASQILSSIITKPIIELTKTASLMKTHEYRGLNKLMAEDEIADLSKSLHDLYQELNQNISSLEKELKKEKTLDKMRNQFVAQVSHEIKTPLSIIGGYVQLLEDKLYASEEEKNTCYVSINHEIKQLDTMVKNLLELSKLESDPFSITLKPIELSAYLKNLFTRISTMIHAHGLEVHAEVRFDPLMVNIDPDRFEQVIKNLTINAIEHATGLISLEAHVSDNTLSITVFNIGETLNNNDLEQVFLPFYKAKNKKNGTGLGLTIAKRIIEAHQGSLQVKNRSDGVEFLVTIKTN